MTQLQTNLPEKSGEYKVIQASLDGKQYLWSNHYYGHGDCLASLLETEGNRFGLYSRHKQPFKMSEDRFAEPEELTDLLTYKTMQDPTTPLKMEIPVLDGEGYHVLGMGKVRINTEDRTIKFYGQSMSYGIGLYKEQIDLLKELKPDWDIIVSS